MITGVDLNALLFLDQGAGLIAIQARHHDVDENDVRMGIGDLRQGIEAVDCR